MSKDEGTRRPGAPVQFTDLVTKTVTVGRAVWAQAATKVASEGSNMSEMARLCAALIVAGRTSITEMKQQLAEENTK